MCNACGIRWRRKNNIVAKSRYHFVIPTMPIKKISHSSAGGSSSGSSQVEAYLSGWSAAHAAHLGTAQKKYRLRKMQIEFLLQDENIE